MRTPPSALATTRRWPGWMGRRYGLWRRLARITKVTLAAQVRLALVCRL